MKVATEYNHWSYSRGNNLTAWTFAQIVFIGQDSIRD